MTISTLTTDDRDQLRATWDDELDIARRVRSAGDTTAEWKYPVGNTGGADVSAFAPMPVPSDLQPLLPETMPDSGRIVNHDVHDTTDTTATIPTDTPASRCQPDVAGLDDGDTFELHIAPMNDVLDPVRKRS